jgi:hypothetical protein
LKPSALERLSSWGSIYHLEEATRIASYKRARWINFFWEVVRWYLLLPTDILANEEVRLGRPLAYNEPFTTFWVRQQVRTFTLREPERVDAMAEKVREFTQNQGILLKERRQLAKMDFKVKEPRQKIVRATREWWQEAEAHIADWINDFLRANQQTLGLPDVSTQWPRPEDLPVIWAMHAYQMARVAIVIRENYEISDSDVHDAHHYTMATFADAIVTLDNNFVETTQLIPNHKPIIQFNEFAALLGIRPH